MIEAIVLLVVAVVGVVLVAAVVVRDGIAHTELQRRLQAQTRINRLFRNLAGAMGAFGYAAAFAGRHMVNMAAAFEQVTAAQAATDAALARMADEVNHD